MAIDTANKRLSALGIGNIHIIMPFPDGSLGLDDRAILQKQYTHDSFPSPGLDLFHPQILNLKQSGQVNSSLKQSGQILWVQ